MGEFVSNVSQGIDTYSIREPLGVCAGICPFNFPAMIPLWVLTETLSSPISGCTWSQAFILDFSTPPLLFGFHLCMSFLYFPNLWQNVFSACLFQNDLNKVLLWWHLQMFPVAVTCGNTFVLKPSEKDPGKVNRCVYVCRIIQSRMRLGSFLFPGMCMIIGCFFLWTAWYYDDLVPVHYRICICAILTMYVAWELLRKSLAKRD